MARVFLTNGNDRLAFTYDHDEIYGLGGDDVLYGLSGNDTIRGGDGDDEIHGGPGRDTLLGEDGEDELWGDRGKDVIYGGKGNDRIDGGDDNDALFGGNDDDILFGQSGDDTLKGGTGDDILIGGSGDDRLEGQSNADILDGGDGNDILLGGSGNDQFDGGSGDDLLEGGSGDDFFVVGEGFDRVLGDSGDDMVVLNDTSVGDFMSVNGIFDGGSDVDTLQLHSVRKSFFPLGPIETKGWHVDLEGLSYLNGFGDPDFTVTETAETINVEIAPGINPPGTVITLNFENVLGSSSDDEILGTDGANVLSGGAGDDVLEGRGGDDVLSGGLGNDIIYGGAGNDTADYTYSTTSWLIDLDKNSANGIGGGIESGQHDYVAVDNLRLGSGNDLVYGDSIANRLEGGAGDDFIDGRAGDDILGGGDGNDTLVGGAGIDTADYTASSHSWKVYLDSGNATTVTGPGEFDKLDVENIWMGSGDDTITGSSDNNVIDGGAGDDVIDGGRGNDVLTGGAGSDTFVFQMQVGSFESDRVTDYDPTVDILDLSGTNIDSFDELLSRSFDSKYGLVIDMQMESIVLEGVRESMLIEDGFIF